MTTVVPGRGRQSIHGAFTRVRRPVQCPVIRSACPMSAEDAAPGNWAAPLQTDEREPMRLDYHKTLPEASRAMAALEQVVSSSTIEAELRELVKLRASQINGCAYCVDM